MNTQLLQRTPGLRTSIACALCVAFGLSGCGWVDSTGRQSNDNPDVFFDANGGDDVLFADEQSTLNLEVGASDSDGLVTAWRWSDTPQAEGRLAACENNSAFVADAAADSLQAACVNAAECALEFQQQGEGTGSVQFLLNTPELRAPVGVRYTLDILDNDGGTARVAFTFCLQSINEAPVANDDTFTVLEGQTLFVSPSGTNLLSNDVDDDDAGNQPLRVLTSAARRPAAARAFELREDGGFTYAFSGQNLMQDLSDSFDYIVTDGVHESIATATIRIVAQNDAPVATQPSETVEVVAGTPFEYDVRPFFTDPEGATLGYRVLGDSLPPSGAIVLGGNGLLAGTAQSEDVGLHQVGIMASDGFATAEIVLPLRVAANQPVEVAPLEDVEVLVSESINLDVSSSFSDPEGESISYSLIYDDDAVALQINPRTGVIFGFISRAGDYLVNIIASDGTSTPITVPITFTVMNANLAPEFSGEIEDQTVARGDRIAAIRPDFNDPDGDPLVYSTEGEIPLGLTLGTEGALSGRPTRRGTYENIRIIATDPSGLSASTNPFTLTVE